MSLITQSADGNLYMYDPSGKDPGVPGWILIDKAWYVNKGFELPEVGTYWDTVSGLRTSDWDKAFQSWSGGAGIKAPGQLMSSEEVAESIQKIQGTLQGTPFQTMPNAAMMKAVIDATAGSTGIAAGIGAGAGAVDYSAPLGGLTGAVDYSPLVEGWDTSLEEISPYAQYMKTLGLPGYGLSPYQGWQAQQFNPFYASYKAGSFLNPPAEGIAPRSFAGFLGSQEGSYKNALNLLRQAGALPGGDVLGQQEFVGTLGAELNDLVYAALRQKYAPVVAKSLAGNVPGIQQGYLAQTGGVGNQLISEILKRYGLSL